jgi:hypothetical protein
MRALEIAQEAAEAAAKIDGSEWVRLCLGEGALVYVGEINSYAAADRLLADTGCQAAFGRLGAEFGYSVERDEFLLDPPQVYPFLRR